MLKANDFERIEGGALIRVQIWSNVKRESKIYIRNKKGVEEKACSLRREVYNVRLKQKLK